MGLLSKIGKAISSGPPGLPGLGSSKKSEDKESAKPQGLVTNLLGLPEPPDPFRDLLLGDEDKAEAKKLQEQEKLLQEQEEDATLAELVARLQAQQAQRQRLQQQGILAQQPQQPLVGGGNDSVARAIALAGLNPNLARQAAIGGQFQTSQAFNISGQRFLTSADPNIILRNAGFQPGATPGSLNTVA